MIEKIKNKMVHVKELLTKNSSLRDDDIKLMKQVWADEIGLPLKNVTAAELVDLIGRSKLSNPETIRRSRQKVQEKNPELRGESHKAKSELEKETRKQIRKL